MHKLALFLKNKVQPGKRDEVYRLWAKHLQPRVETSAVQEVYFFCYDDNDPDTFYIFELYNDRAAMMQAGQAPWFAAYMQEVAPLLTGQVDFGMATPLWAKGATV